MEVFDEILKTEKAALIAQWPDLSLREFHQIEDVCLAEDKEGDNRAGTLTTAVNILEKKGYLERRRDSKDRRVAHIYPTEKACQADALHQKFHREMVDEVRTSDIGAVVGTHAGPGAAGIVYFVK